MVNTNRQAVLVHIPQVLEGIFSQKAGVGEDQRGAVGADQIVKLRYGPGRRVAAPRHALPIRQQYVEIRIGPLFAYHEGDSVNLSPRGQPSAKRLGLRYGCRQGRALQIGRDRLQA